MPESAVWSSVWDRNFGGHIPTVQGLRQGCVFLRVLGGFRSGKSSCWASADFSVGTEK